MVSLCRGGEIACTAGTLTRLPLEKNIGARYGKVGRLPINATRSGRVKHFTDAEEGQGGKEDMDFRRHHIGVLHC